jgi:chromosome segregation ATPase|tara:strand:+ start:452 stop:955 length:504 start_codon:yes stop_codon:yes gene_type:complete
MLTSKIGGSKALTKLLDLLSNASEIKVLIQQLVEQEVKTKAVLDDLTKVETVDEYVQNLRLELDADIEAHQGNLAEFADQLVIHSEKVRQHDEHVEKLKSDREEFESDCQSRTAVLDEKQLILDDKLDKVADLKASTEHELEQARSLRAEYESKLKELQDSVARLKA